MDTTTINIKDIDKRRYFLLFLDEFKKLRGFDYENNPYIESELVKIGTNKSNPHLEAKYPIKDTSLLLPFVKTICLKTSSESGYLALDVDNPESEKAKKLASLITEDDFIV
jgi:hypothetical protein